MDVGQHGNQVAWSLDPTALGVRSIILTKLRYLFSFHHEYIY